jgi:hypothetical protein
MATASGIGLAMKYFGKTYNQTLSQFRDDFNRLTDESKAELAAGLSDGTLTYPDRPAALAA